ncbi:MAG: PrsW family intramembrane metalloprotease [Candidatus Pacebacteria bacterium]|nr:PrsW family intramembrane metalloprotease [Candidatus Paceibacterota bacterium]
MTNELILYAFLGGVLPTIFWLWFWLKADKLNPEPKRYIAYSFVFGILSALLVLPVEEFLSEIITGTGIILIVALSFSEELFKYLGAYFSALNKKYMDEPIDAVIYLITVALGFAALENSLFLLSAMKSNGAEISRIVLVGNMRFIGATLLHTLCSGVIGLFIAFSFYKKSFSKKVFLLIGFILSVTLHTFFNFFIINSESKIFIIFLAIWVAIIIMILLLEKIKHMRKRFV